MSYKHDIFVSYKWGGDIKEWVDSIFLPILKNELEYLKGSFEDDDIFHDVDQTLFGSTVPDVLRDGVANSKCMICVISKSYFTNSKWCPSELSAMLKREEETQVRNQPDRVGLVFPLIFMNERERAIEDKNLVYRIEEVKKLLFEILPLYLDENKFYRIGGGFKKSDNYDDLRAAIRDWIRRGILKRIQNPPEWRDGWGSISYFKSRFNDESGSQNFPLPKL